MAWTRSTPQRGSYVDHDTWEGTQDVSAKIWPRFSMPAGIADLKIDSRGYSATAAHIATGSVCLAALALLLPGEAMACIFAGAALVCFVGVERMSEFLKLDRSAMFANSANGQNTALLELSDAPPSANAIPVNASVPSCPKQESGALPVLNEVIGAQMREAKNEKAFYASSSRKHCDAIDTSDWSKLTNHMSHELRTPLNAVLGFSELLRSEALGPVGVPAYSEYAQAIHESGRRLLKSAEDAVVITSLLTSHHTDLQSSCAIDVRALVDDALAFHQATLTQLGSTVVTGIADDLMVHGDPQIVRQLLINALDTMIDLAWSKNDFTLNVDAHADERGVSIEIRTTPSAQSSFCEGQDVKAEPFSTLLLNTLCQINGVTAAHATTDQGCHSIHLAFPSNAQADLFASCN